MRVKNITLLKQLKAGLPNYSSLTASMEVTIELTENEKPNLDMLWEKIGKQLDNQVKKQLIEKRHEVIE